MDEAEFDEFYAASFRRVTSQVYAMIGDLDEAAECVQEAFARAWANRRKLDRLDYPEAWVRTTAHRLAISRWRRRQRAKRAPDRAVSAPLVVPEVDESHVALVAALERFRSRSARHWCSTTSRTSRSTRSPPRSAYPKAPSRPG